MTTREGRNQAARKLLAYFYEGYEQVGGRRNFYITPQQHGVLEDVGMTRKEYDSAMHHLIDLDLLEPKTLGGGCALTTLGVEVSEDKRLLQELLPVAATLSRVVPGTERCALTRHELRSLLRTALGVCESVRETPRIEIDVVVEWLPMMEILTRTSEQSLAMQIAHWLEPFRRTRERGHVMQHELAEAATEIVALLRGLLDSGNARPTKVDPNTYVHFLTTLLEMEHRETRLGVGHQLGELAQFAGLDAGTADKCLARLADEGLGYWAHDDLDEVFLHDSGKVELTIRAVEQQVRSIMTLETTVELLSGTRPPDGYDSLMKGLARKHGLAVDPCWTGSELHVLVRWDLSARSEQLESLSADALEQAAMRFGEEAERVLRRELEQPAATAQAVTFNVHAAAVGVVGAGASIRDAQIEVVGGDRISQDGTDMAEFVSMLSELRALLTQQAARGSDDDQVALGRVVEAQQAAKKKDRGLLRRVLGPVRDKLIEVAVNAGAQELAEQVGKLLPGGTGS